MECCYPFSPPDFGSHSTKIGGSYGYGVAGGRIGYALDRALFYVKSGAVFTTTQTNYADPWSNDYVYTSAKSNSVGYAIGAGIEYALPFEWSENISIKTEYLYLGIDRTQTTTGHETLFPTNVYTTTDKISGIHTAKLGINYKF